jgi:hypothetical protein
MFPQVTDVVYDTSQMERLIADSVNITKLSVDSVLDKRMFSFISTYMKDGFELMERLIDERDITIRTIIETTTENIHLVNSIRKYEIKHLSDLRGNFGITDKRTYMICMFHNNELKPSQALFSNLKSLVDKQQILFDKLWKIAIPLRDRNKELEYQLQPEFHKSFRYLKDTKDDIAFFIGQATKELQILSSINMLNYFKEDSEFWLQLSDLSRKGVFIKVLTDGYESQVILQINKINSLIGNNQIQLGYSTKLGNIEQLLIICDDKQLLEISHKVMSRIELSVSNNRNHVLVQEILFEKCWNEVKSLSGISAP